MSAVSSRLEPADTIERAVEFRHELLQRAADARATGNDSALTAAHGSRRRDHDLIACATRASIFAGVAAFLAKQKPAGRGAGPPAFSEQARVFSGGRLCRSPATAGSSSKARSDASKMRHRPKQEAVAADERHVPVAGHVGERLNAIGTGRQPPTVFGARGAGFGAMSIGIAHIGPITSSAQKMRPRD